MGSTRLCRHRGPQPRSPQTRRRPLPGHSPVSDPFQANWVRTQTHHKKRAAKQTPAHRTIPKCGDEAWAWRKGEQPRVTTGPRDGAKRASGRFPRTHRLDVLSSHSLETELPHCSQAHFKVYRPTASSETNHRKLPGSAELLRLPHHAGDVWTLLTAYSRRGDEQSQHPVTLGRRRCVRVRGVTHTCLPLFSYRILGFFFSTVFKYL